MINFGAIAQLEERLICIQEVVGSIPSSSTIFNTGRVSYDFGIRSFLLSSYFAPIAQLVEHFHGKEGVISSNLIGSSILKTMKIKILAIILRPLTLIRRLMKKKFGRSASVDAPQSEKLLRRPYL